MQFYVNPKSLHEIIWIIRLIIYQKQISFVNYVGIECKKLPQWFLRFPYLQRLPQREIFWSKSRIVIKSDLILDIVIYCIIILIIRGSRASNQCSFQNIWERLNSIPGTMNRCSGTWCTTVMRALWGFGSISNYKAVKNVRLINMKKF